MDSSNDDSFYELRLRLTKKNINIIRARAGVERYWRVDPRGGKVQEDRPTTYIIAEYSLEKPDGRVIWPKMAFKGDSLEDALLNAEDNIDFIRDEA